VSRTSSDRRRTPRRAAGGALLAALLAGALTACALAALLVAPATAAASGQASSSATGTSAAGLPAATAPPATIRVARRFPANDPGGVIVRVDTVDFRTYCVRVLSHEWAPPSAFSDAALRAGALAVKDYAWYWATHQTKLPDVAAWGADVDDTTNYQVYMDWDYGARYWDAVDRTWGTVMTRAGQVFQASYYAGQYSPAATDGNHMTQWGSQYWAAQGMDERWILDFYYPGSQFTTSGVTTPVAASGSSAWTGPHQPRGAAKLELIGPVQLSPGPYRKGQTLHAQFTLRNDGAKRGTWAVVTLVARGPGDQERDLGSATHVSIAPGAYRLFTGSVKLDLVGHWHGWLIVGDGEALSLLDGGAPFQFTVGPAAAHPQHAATP